MLKTPTIHLNGTSKRELMDGYLKAHRAVNDAIEALCKAAPHGRDYYPQGGDAIQVAIAEHRARLNKLGEVLREIETIAMIVNDDGVR